MTKRARDTEMTIDEPTNAPPSPPYTVTYESDTESPETHTAIPKTETECGRLWYECAEETGHAECVRSVIKSGADVDVARNDFEAVRKAAERRDVDTLDVLLEHALYLSGETCSGAFRTATGTRSQDRAPGDEGVGHIRALIELCHALADRVPDDRALASALNGDASELARHVEQCYVDLRAQ